jgi:Ca2+-binding EF-hand superfamily protein
MSDFWVRKMKTYFHRHDLDKDGTLSKNDFVEFAQSFVRYQKLDEEKGKLLESQILKVWSTFSGGNVEVILSENGFIESLKKQILEPAFNQTITEPLQILFHAVDADNDGSIEKDELAQFFESLGLDKSAAPVSFEAMDTDKDGIISLDEFIATGLAFFTSEDESSHSKLFLGPLV